MDKVNLHLVYEALTEAQHLISSEIQCVMDEDVYCELLLSAKP